MNVESILDAGKSKDFHLLVFKVGGIALGGDMDQIREICDPADLDDDVDSFWFSDKVPFPENSRNDASPKALVFKVDKPTATLVDQIDEILVIPVHSIQPLPPLIEKRIKPKIVWGGILLNQEIVLLVDFFRMLNS